MWLSSFSTDQRHAMLGLAHNVIVSDGLLDPNEEGMLLELKQEMGLSEVEELDYLEWKEFKTFSKTNARAWLWSSI